MHGDFELIGLSTLLSIFDMERRSGVLLIHRTGQAAKLWLGGGRVLRARMEGRVRRSGKPAVYELCNWRDGRFEFTQAQIDVADEIDTPTVRLLMEGARRIDEAAVALPC
ncbi:MAG: DUF4388 domain-containing protein [Pseudomonadota bacterium]